MKGIYKLIFFVSVLVLCFSAGGVLAFNTNQIDISDDINVVFSDVDGVKVRLGNGISNVMYYQFINSSERELITFEQQNSNIDDKYNQCVINNGKSCADDYNLSKAELSNEIPMFNDANWTQSISDSRFHNISSEEYSNYWLWVKAEDSSGKLVYAVFYKIGGAYIEAQDNSLVNYNSRYYVYNNLAKASMAFSGIGVSVFVLSLIYLLYEKKYGVL